MDLATVAITGVTGFIGSALAEKLVQQGHEVFGLVRHCAARDLRTLEGVLDQVILVNADIADLTSVMQALKCANPDYVCHLAALSPVRLSFERPFDYERVNYLGTMNLCHAVMGLPDYRKRKIVAASTAEVYGIHVGGRPLTEEDRLIPSSPYAVPKAACDMYLSMASHVYDLNAVILRPVNTYGRRFEKGFLVEYLVTSMLRGERPYVGAPDSMREYMHVIDHVNAYLLAIERGIKGETYNISTMQGITNRELALRVSELTAFDESKIAFGAYPPGYPQRPSVSDQPYILLDNSKAKRDLGWSPTITLDDGIRRTIEYWKSNSAGPS